jgi:N-acylneuraminate cytidylyltransferase
VTPAPITPYKMWRLHGDGPMEPLLRLDGVDEPYNAPRQRLPQVHWQTGHVDVVRSEVILGGSMSGGSIVPVVVDRDICVDIDTDADLVLAEALLGTDHVVERGGSSR